MISRREILSVLGAIPAASSLQVGSLFAQASNSFPRRLLGRTGRTVVPLGLGGQALVAVDRSGRGRARHHRARRPNSASTISIPPMLTGRARRTTARRFAGSTLLRPMLPTIVRCAKACMSPPRRFAATA